MFWYIIIIKSEDWPIAIVYGKVMKQWYALYVFRYSYWIYLSVKYLYGKVAHGKIANFSWIQFHHIGHSDLLKI